jgi:hypothetical protein
MATSRTILDNQLRKRYLEMLKEFFNNRDEEVLVTGTNELCFPCVDDEGNEKFIQLIIKIPKGSRDGEVFDGYSLAEDFKMKQELNEQKKKEKEEKKKKKIERDKKLREEKKENKGE